MHSANLQTLNPLFSRGNYFTEAALLGPQNFIDVHPGFRLQPSDTWSFDLGSDFYWRESLDDGIYTPVGAVGTVILGIVLLGEPANAARFISVALIIAGIIGLKLATPA
jgi:hypothetical protein